MGITVIATLGSLPPMGTPQRQEIGRIESMEGAWNGDDDSAGGSGDASDEAGAESDRSVREAGEGQEAEALDAAEPDLEASVDFYA